MSVFQNSIAAEIGMQQVTCNMMEYRQCSKPFSSCNPKEVRNMAYMWSEILVQNIIWQCGRL